MPSEPKPKTFVAAAPFTYRHRTYAVGEVVDDRRVVDRLLSYGDRFIKVKRTRSPAVDTANPDQSTKED